MASFKDLFLKQAGSLGLADEHMGYIVNRYIEIVAAADRQLWKVYFLYHLLTIIITAGGVAVTAFVSVDKGNEPIHAVAGTAISWIVWVLGFTLSLSNACLHAFDIPNKNTMCKVVTEKLRCEGWSYLTGTGRYSTLKTTDARHACFVTRVERIQLKSLKAAQEIENAVTLGEILGPGPSARNSDHVVIIPDELAKIPD